MTATYAEMWEEDRVEADKAWAAKQAAQAKAKRDEPVLKPHSIGTYSIGDGVTPAMRRAAMGWAGRHNGGKPWPKGTVLPETSVLVCPRVKVADLPEGHLKQSHIEHLEHNQQIASCCRHPENHWVEAHKSHPDELAPDKYNFICTCGAVHKFFCVGRTDDKRPVWDAS